MFIVSNFFSLICKKLLLIEYSNFLTTVGLGIPVISDIDIALTPTSSADDVGVNAMSISDITGIPRPTVVRKLEYSIKSNFLHINEKKLLTMNITGSTLKKVTKLQDLNMINLSNFLYRIFNQIKITNTN